MWTKIVVKLKPCGASSDVGGDGYYWSSVVNGDGVAYGFYFNKRGIMDPQNYNGRDVGILVRCVAR